MGTFMLLLATITIVFMYISCSIGAQDVHKGVHNGHILSSLHRHQGSDPADVLSGRISARRIITSRSFYPLLGSSTLEDLLDKENKASIIENDIVPQSNRGEFANSNNIDLNYGTLSAFTSSRQDESDNNSLSMFYGQDDEANSYDQNNQKAVSDSSSAELEKAELHINNHKQSTTNNNMINSNTNKINKNSHSRHGLYDGHYQANAQSPYQSYSKYGSSSSAYTNSLNLNYIHSLLTKPSSSNSLSNLLNFNSNSLPSPYGLSLQSGYISSYYSAPPLPSMNSIQQQTSLPSPPQFSTIATLDQQPQSQQQQQLNQSVSSIAGSSIDFSGSLLCGKQQVGVREPRIVGGNNSYEGEFPWAVSIQRQGNHHCGGVIVGRRWILTAAHCVRSQLVGNLVVRTGGHTLSRSSNHVTSHLSRDHLVDQIVMHDDFSRYDNLTASQMKSSANTNNADIALLRLKNDIIWNELAWPVCFPHRDSGNFSGHDATVIGWGKLNEKSEDFSNELQKVKLTIIDNKVCQNWFRQAGREMPIDDRIICAGFKNGGKDACHGDSGGPLLSKINGQYVVVGVVSTGIGCARPLLPGLYSRVSSYINWIERYVNC